MKQRYPDAVYVGLSDGAADLLPWLAGHADVQVLDYYHANGHVHSDAAAFRHEAAPPGEALNYQTQEACRHLRYDAGAAAGLLAAFGERMARTPPVKSSRRPRSTSATTRTGWTMPCMKPPGCGVTEAGCKLLVKNSFATRGCHGVSAWPAIF
ncbi:MAG: hypothetical protein V4726_06105 [Verrucomicrobiota bacterium]